MTTEELIARACGDYRDEDFPDNIDAYDYELPTGGGGAELGEKERGTKSAAQGPNKLISESPEIRK